MQALRITQTTVECLSHRSLAIPLRNTLRQIHERPYHRRDRDAGQLRHLVRTQAADSVHPDSRTPTGITDPYAHLDWSPSEVGEQLPEDGCRAMAYNRRSATREHRRHLLRVQGHQRADTVDATMHPTKPLSPQAPIHGVRGQSDLKKLLPRDQSVLTRGNVQDRLLDNGRISHSRHPGVELLPACAQLAAPCAAKRATIDLTHRPLRACRRVSPHTPHTRSVRARISTRQPKRRDIDFED